MSVTKRKRELLTASRAICPEATIEITRGTQLQINIVGPGGTRKVFCAMTPSDHRDIKNIKRSLMQAARDVGCIPPR